jgi:hypothetical protein
MSKGEDEMKHSSLSRKKGEERMGSSLLYSLFPEAPKSRLIPTHIEEGILLY